MRLRDVTHVFRMTMRAGGAVVVIAACNGSDSPTDAAAAGNSPLPAAIAFSLQPVSVNACAAIPAVQVAVVNSAGQPVAAFAGEVSVEITSGTGAPSAVLSGMRTVKASAGVATFANLSINIPGTVFRLSATAPSAGVVALASAPFTVSQGPAVALAFATSPSTALVNNTLSTILVTEVDNCGTTILSPGHTVTIGFGNNPGGGTLSGGATKPTVQGVATFNDLVVTKAGAAYTLVASAPGLTAATSTAFTVAGPGYARRSLNRP